MLKRDYVLLALTEIGIAKSNVDITVDELTTGAARLDMMMASWDSEGIHVSWPITASSNVDADLSTTTPPQANKAIVTNLAIELAPSYGVTCSPETKRNAAVAKAALVSSITIPRPRRTRVGTPLGAGSRPEQGPLRSPFVLPVQPNVTIGDDSEFDF